MSITVGIVDDDPIVRSALRAELDSDCGIDVLFECPDGAQAVTEAARTTPDVVLMDIRMPELDGIDATSAIRLASPGTKVLLITAVDLDGDAAAAVAAGASGILVKSSTLDVLTHAVQTVHYGGTVFSYGSIGRWIAAKSPDPSQGGGFVDRSLRTPLTAREKEVLTLLCRAHNNFEISQRLGLAESTVKTHVSSVITKLGVASRLQAVVRAHDLGLVD